MPSSAEQRTITIDHPSMDSVTVHLRRGARTRSVRLRVDESGVVTASVPKRFAASRLDPLVRERGEWICEMVQRMSRATQAVQVDVERGDPIPYLGLRVPVQLTRAGTSTRGQWIEGVLHLRVPCRLDVHDALDGWYRREARDVFQARVAHWAPIVGVQPGAVSVRAQRTRWGSCSHKGDLSFNRKLLLAPAWVLDSIVVHELCHIHEHNHSARFWAHVDEHFPRHREASEWLRVHGDTLRVERPTAAPAMRADHQQPVDRDGQFALFSDDG